MLAPLLSYLLWSPCLILLNKHIMTKLGLPFPIFNALLGQLGSVILSRSIDPPPLASTPLSRHVHIAVAALTAAGVSMGQYPYLYLSTSFIQMLKAFTPTVACVLLTCFGLENPTCIMWTFIVCQSLSTCLASFGSFRSNPKGVMFMISAILIESMRVCAIQKMCNSDISGPRILYEISPCIFLFMALSMAVLEGPYLWDVPDAIQSAWPYLTLSCVGGALVNLASMQLTVRMSALTMKSITLLRNSAMVLTFSLLLNESIAVHEWIGYAGMVSCFSAYSCEEHLQKMGSRGECIHLVQRSMSLSPLLPLSPPPPLQTPQRSWATRDEDQT